MSKELVAALGIAEGAPPPWLINMQRYGPPPSYPHMKIPGLNAPLPSGAAYGYQPGGWGKPPVDEYGRPLYGDVFGYADAAQATGAAGGEFAVPAEAPLDKALRWGALEVHEYDEEEGEQEGDGEGSEGDEDADRDGDGGGRAYDPSGAETPSTLDGAHSVALSGISGLETPDTVDLRKRAGMDTPDSTYTSVAGPIATAMGAGAGRELYHVIQERQQTGGAAAVGQMFGSDRVYVLPNSGAGSASVSGSESSQMNGCAVQGEQEGEDQAQGAGGGAQGKKRKMDSSATAMKRIKEFKF